MKTLVLILILFSFACKKENNVQPQQPQPTACYSQYPSIGTVASEMTVKDFGNNEFLLRATNGDWFDACNLNDSCKIDGNSYYVEGIVKQVTNTDPTIVSMGAPLVITKIKEID